MWGQLKALLLGHRMELYSVMNSESQLVQQSDLTRELYWEEQMDNKMGLDSVFSWVERKVHVWVKLRANMMGLNWERWMEELWECRMELYSVMNLGKQRD